MEKSFVQELVPTERVPLHQAARELGVNLSTIHRWRLRGVKGVRLDTLAVGHKLYVSRAALEDFLARTNSAAKREPAAEAPSARRRKQIEIAEAKCRAAGIAR